MPFGLSRKQPPIGLDISDHSIEVLHLSFAREVLAYGRIVLEDGIVREGNILDKKKLALKLRDALRGTKPLALYPLRYQLDVIFGLPSSRTFIDVFTMPRNVTGAELQKKVVEVARGVIPFDTREVYWDFEVIGPGDAAMQTVLYAAVPKTVVSDYLDVLAQLPLIPIVCDVEIANLGRAVVKVDTGPTMVVDIGAGGTTAGIFGRSGALELSISIPLGGSHFTKAITEGLKIDRDEAEKAKRLFGLDSSKADNIVFSLLRPAIEKLIKEFAAAIAHYENSSREKVQEIILVGGSALLPKLVEYVGGSLRRRTKIGDPLRGILKSELLDNAGHPVFFTNVIGLCRRDPGAKSPGINFLKGIEGPSMGRQRQVEMARTVISSFVARLRRSLIFGASFLGLALIFLAFVMYWYVFRAPL